MNISKTQLHLKIHLLVNAYLQNRIRFIFRCLCSWSCSFFPVFFPCAVIIVATHDVCAILCLWHCCGFYNSRSTCLNKIILLTWRHNANLLLKLTRQTVCKMNMRSEFSTLRLIEWIIYIPFSRKFDPE